MNNPAWTDAILAQRSALETAFNAGDVDQLAPLVTDGIVWSTAIQQPWIGRDEVLAGIGRFFEEHDYELRFGPPRIDTDGSRAVDRTNFESRVLTTSTAPVDPHRGSVVMIWALEDGWRLAAYFDVGSTLFT